MASEWAKEKAEKILKPEGCLHDDSCEGPYGEEPCDCWVAEVRQEIAAALDEARDEERWECWAVARTTLLDFPDARWLSDVLALMQKRLAARGPMRGPEEE